MYQCIYVPVLLSLYGVVDMLRPELPGEPSAKWSQSVLLAYRRGFACWLVVGAARLLVGRSTSDGRAQGAACCGWRQCRVSKASGRAQTAFQINCDIITRAHNRFACQRIRLHLRHIGSPGPRHYTLAALTTTIRSATPTTPATTCAGPQLAGHLF